MIRAFLVGSCAIGLGAFVAWQVTKPEPPASLAIVFAESEGEIAPPSRLTIRCEDGRLGVTFSDARATGEPGRVLRVAFSGGTLDPLPFTTPDRASDAEFGTASVGFLRGLYRAEAAVVVFGGEAHAYALDAEDIVRIETVAATCGVPLGEAES